MCMYNLTEESIELFALKITDNEINENENENEIEDATPLLLTQLCSGESQCTRHKSMTPKDYTIGLDKVIEYNKATNNDYVWDASSVTDYVTIVYKPGKDADPTGCLKIVNLNQKIVAVKDAQDIENGQTVLANNDAILKVNGACQELADLTTSTYPAAFKTSLPISWQVVAKAYAKTCSMTADQESEADAMLTDAASLASKLVALYDNLKKSMPVMMGYRYQRQVFDMLTNIKGATLTNYSAKKSNFTARALPILDMKQLKEMFKKSMDIQRLYNLQYSQTFSYSHCVVDLNPNYADYNAEVDNDLLKIGSDENVFPVRFVDGLDVNASDEYKTSKIAFVRVDAISADKFSKFYMGSHKTDYDKVQDPIKRRFADPDAIVDAAASNYARVLLGNGGSYQKKRVDIKESKYGDDSSITNTDIYQVTAPVLLPYTPDSSNPDVYFVPGESGYRKTTSGTEDYRWFRNKHFFIDPFQLTIAQWCYAKLNHTQRGSASKSTARSLLSDAGILDEMRRSYWKYLYTFERSRWTVIANEHGVVENEVSTAIEQLVSLEDSDDAA